MKKLLFIVNPRSGKAQIKNRLLELLDLFIRYGYLPSVYITQKPMDGVHGVAQFGNTADLIVCSGGDGTLNETISGMMQLKTRKPLGYIPTGSTNDFASSLQISKHPMTAAIAAMEGEPYDIDIGCFCEKQYFVYIAAFGAFTEVAYMTPQEKKNLLGHQAYMLEGIKSLMSLKTHEMKIQCDDFVLEGDFLFGMITNTISVGGFRGLVKQDVALNDGEFEVLLIRTPKTPVDFSNILTCMLLKEEQNEYVHKFKSKFLHIQSKEDVDWVLDGEFGGRKTEVTIQNLPRTIKIMRKHTK